jgi:protein-S-isoprenylcysteine O-methyltransferase Ste14
MTPWSKVARRIRVPLGFAFVVFYFWLARPTPKSLLLGLLGIVPGLFLRALASGYVRKNEELAMSGPYAYTRNPLYLGSLLIAAGFAAASRSWWIVIALAVMFVAIYLPVIRGEEDFLRRKFPEYEEYSQRVPRMLPRFTLQPRSNGQSSLSSLSSLSSFSWALYRRHREYNALLGAAGIVVALVVKMKLFTA